MVEGELDELVLIGVGVFSEQMVEVQVVVVVEEMLRQEEQEIHLQ
jgi:hypothetical protein